MIAVSPTAETRADSAALSELQVPVCSKAASFLKTNRVRTVNKSLLLPMLDASQLHARNRCSVLIFEKMENYKHYFMKQLIKLVKSPNPQTNFTFSATSWNIFIPEHCKRSLCCSPVRFLKLTIKPLKLFRLFITAAMDKLMSHNGSFFGVPQCHLSSSKSIL